MDRPGLEIFGLVFVLVSATVLGLIAGDIERDQKQSLRPPIAISAPPLPSKPSQEDKSTGRSVPPLFRIPPEMRPEIPPATLPAERPPNVGPGNQISGWSDGKGNSGQVVLPSRIACNHTAYELNDDPMILPGRLTGPASLDKLVWLGYLESELSSPVGQIVSKGSGKASVYADKGIDPPERLVVAVGGVGKVEGQSFPNGQHMYFRPDVLAKRTTTTEPKNWTEIARLSGTGNKRSGSFRLSGSLGRIYLNPGPKVNSFSAYIVPEGQPPNLKTKSDLIATADFAAIGSKPTAGWGLFDRAPGNYYLYVEADGGSWEFTIQEAH